MDDSEPEVRKAKRIRQFASFFKNYMGVSSFVVAALPVPVTMLRVIPVHAPDAGSLSVITSLTCFLILAFIFFNRHSLARRLFEPIGYVEDRGPDQVWVRTGRYTTARFEGPRRWPLPLTIASLIGTTVLLFLVYILLILQLQNGGGRLPSELHRVLLMGVYTGFFATAEAAFVLMATKEYLQDLLKISEIDLIDPDPMRGLAEAVAPTPPAAPHGRRKRSSLAA